MNFLEERIITRFDVLAKITTYNAKAFILVALNEFCFKYVIILSHSSNYYPQGSELAEYTNKNIMNIVKKIVGDNKKSWDNKIKYAIWEDLKTTKTSIGKPHLSYFMGWKQGYL